MRSKSARAIGSTAAWFFGLATSILFISLWGRAVVIDTDALQENLEPLGQTEQVVGIFSNWMVDQLVTEGVPEEIANGATELAMLTPQVETSLERLAGEVVAAAASEDPDGGVVDVASIMEPTVPAVAGALAASGAPIPEERVAAFVAGLDPLTIREPSEPPTVGRASPAAQRLGTAAILALVVLLTFGSLYVSAAPDRMKAFRTLLTRFGLTGLSFALLLKLGAWVLDPGGGRAPISQSLSLLADSKWAIPAVIGGVVSVVALVFWLGRVRPVATHQHPSGQPTQPTG